MYSSINITFIRLLLILSLYLSYIFACNCSYEKNVIVKSNREYDYFASYSSMSTSTPKVLVLEYEYEYTSTITPSLVKTNMDG